ncbi:MAG: hypothetical protein VX228_03490 [Pseudomonadota bacterium]|nr:hypothetical protein [Pseudomonadota bacterium]
MPENEPQGPVNQIVGTTGDDSIATGDNVDHVNGHAGSDTLTFGEGDDLVAGDMVGREWVFVDGQNALLDAAEERQLCAVLARLKKQGTTLVMVIHRSGLIGLADHILALENGRVADYGSRSDVLGRMSGGRRRLEVPLQTASLQDLTDWVCAQFSRGSDADLSKRAELIATELFNLAMASGPQDTPRTCVFQFRFLNARSCEIRLSEDRATGAAQKIQKVATLLRQADANMGSLPKDEAAMAVITQLSDGFDIQNIDGKAMYRAAVSMRNLTLPKAIQH